AGAAWEYTLPDGHNAFAYVFEGQATVGEGEDARALDASEMGVLGGGARLSLRAGDAPARLILVAGRPLREPVARYGPFVMNTRQELMQAFVDFQEGRFSAPWAASGARGSWSGSLASSQSWAWRFLPSSITVIRFSAAPGWAISGRYQCTSWLPTLPSSTRLRRRGFSLGSVLNITPSSWVPSASIARQ